MSADKISFEKAHELMIKYPEYLILDVREEEEYNTGHAENAVLYPVDDIEESGMRDLVPDLDRRIFVYCRSGRRSREAAIKLLSYGYSHVYDLGSLIGWPYGIE